VVEEEAGRDSALACNLAVFVGGRRKWRKGN
jgi:hypothetical protein